MLDFAAARRMMVDGQVRPNDVTDLRLIAAFQDVARERFVPERQVPIAYLDLDVPVTEDTPPRCLLKPMVLAKLIHSADIGDTDAVLDVGAATGYSSAILARVAGSVVALEENPALARRAEEALAGEGVTVVTGPLVTGWRARAPYDVIVMNGATEIVPEALCEQLAERGRLVCVLGRGPDGKAMVYRKVNGDISGRPLFDAAAPLLPGFGKVPAFAF